MLRRGVLCVTGAGISLGFCRSEACLLDEAFLQHAFCSDGARGGGVGVLRNCGAGDVPARDIKNSTPRAEWLGTWGGGSAAGDYVDCGLRVYAGGVLVAGSDYDTASSVYDGSSASGVSRGFNLHAALRRAAQWLKAGSLKSALHENGPEGPGPGI